MATKTDVVAMQLTMQAGDFAAALKAALRIISSHSTIPVLSHVVLTGKEDNGEEGGLLVRASNLETGIVKKVPAVVGTEGAVTVPAEPLSKFVSSLPAAEVLEAVLLQDPDHAAKLTLALTCGDYEARFTGGDAAEFPPGQEIDPVYRASLSLRELLNGIRQIDAAIPEKEGTPSPIGALFRIENSKLLMVGVDGHRLSMREIAMSGDDGDHRLVVPLKALRELPRTFTQLKGDEGGSVEILVAKAGNLIGFRTANTELNSRLLEPKFPAYERVIPTQNSVVITADVDAFQDVLDAVMSLSSANLVRVHVEADSLMLACERSEVGTSRAKLAVTTKGLADPLRVAFNGQYLRDALAAMGTPQMELHLQDAGTPALLVPVADPVQYRGVIMPMRAPVE